MRMNEIPLKRMMFRPSLSLISVHLQDYS
ncbi:hypothetical protein ANCCAN_26395 [Ancylostoma caninum]|uniref:Uncharacterized protein n=1 Tax=Ancylostoma caninum TaxID=29170 RepID=A0A368F8I0_ANCCA|nr:hypothetical protein ANCCAN_26395 [Ancylostoma caninum]